MNRVLDDAGSDGEVEHIHRLVIVQHGVNQAAGKRVAAAYAIQNREGEQLAFKRVTLVPHKRFQAVFTAGMRIAHVSRDALEVWIALDKPLEDFILLLIAGLHRHAVLRVALTMVVLVAPEVIRLDAQQNIDVGEALRAEIASLFPAPQHAAEIAVEADC